MLYTIYRLGLHWNNFPRKHVTEINSETFVSYDSKNTENVNYVGSTYVYMIMSYL